MTNKPLDMPDNYPWLPGSGKSVSGDLGDLAVRLGSIVSYDRRGTILWLDDFSHGVSAWRGNDLINGAKFEVTAERFLSKGFCCKLTSQNITGNTMSIEKGFQPANETSFGVECSFSNTNNLRYFYVTLSYLKNGIQIVSGLRFDFRTNELAFALPVLGYFPLAIIPIPSYSAESFTTLKFVTDVINGKYIRTQFNRKEYDMSQVDCIVSGSSSSDVLFVSFAMSPNAGSNLNLYLDNIILSVGDI